MVRCGSLLFGLPLAAAWPAVMKMMVETPAVDKRQLPALTSLKNKPNTATPPTGWFPEQQYVETRPGTEHEFRRPGPNDQRGQCPGLNAAANHGERVAIGNIESSRR